MPVELGDHLDRLGRQPDLLLRLPQRGRERAIGVPGSRLPPGNAISPWCDGIVSGRFVRIDVRFAVDSSNIATSTAASRLSGAVTSGPARRRQVRRAGARTSASGEDARRSGRGRPTAPDRRAGARRARDQLAPTARRPPRSHPPCDRADYRRRQGRRIATPMTAEWNFATCWEAIADAQPDRPALAQGERHRTLGRVGRPRRPARRGVRRPRAQPTTARSRATSTTRSSTWRASSPRGSAAARPVNVNYRYLEDELPYLLDNSDTEILLFHGVLGEHVAKVAARLPTLKAIVQVDDGSPLVEGALRYEDLIAGARARAARRALGRRPLHPLHRRHHRHAQGRDVAQRGPVRVARPVRRTALRARRCPRTPAGVGAIATAVHGRGRRRSTSPRRRSCTAPGS